MPVMSIYVVREDGHHEELLKNNGETVFLDYDIKRAIQNCSSLEGTLMSIVLQKLV
jgi:hypothetical protein